MHDNQPDWAAIAEKFDLWLPHIAPVGERFPRGAGGDSSDQPHAARADLPANRQR
jgi:hypothetical protein